MTEDLGGEYRTHRTSPDSQLSDNVTRVAQHSNNITRGSGSQITHLIGMLDIAAAVLRPMYIFPKLFEEYN